MDKYYRILGVDKLASMSVIKKAYRQKAKILHPDINKSTDAHEQFILLNEAFEFLQHVKSGKTFDHQKRSYSKKKNRKKTYEAWKRTERENARERARANAKMHFEEFKKTDYYKTTVALEHVTDFLRLLSVIFIFVGVPIIGYMVKGRVGVYGAIAVIFFSVHYWVDVLVHNRPRLDFGELGNSIGRILLTRTFIISSICFVNVVLIVLIGMHTLVSFTTLSICFVALLGFGFVVSFTTHNSLRKVLITVGLGPSLLSLLLLVNFVFTSNPSQETYHFIHQKRWYGTGSYHYYNPRLEKIALIDLENSTYKSYVGIRSFLDFEKMANKNKITYTIADGILGFRVLKSYQFD